MAYQKLIFLATLFLLFSCEKTEDTIAKIIVRDMNAVKVEDATVRMFSQPEDSEIEVEEMTNAAGEAIFDLSSFYSEGQVGLFVLSIEIEKDTLSTTSIIQIVPEEVNELSITLQ